MKLASLRHGRDGRLAVVSRDLTRCCDASAVAPTLQAALDEWATAAPRLANIADQLELGRIAHDPFDESGCSAPLPRSHGWADGSAYVNHVALVRRARGAELPASFWADPLMYRGGSDAFLGPRDPIRIGDVAWGLDFEAEVAVIAGDVPQAASRTTAGQAIELLVLVNDVSLRNLIAPELAKGFGFVQSKAQTAFSPVAVTPDELGPAWDGAKLSLPLLSSVNGALFGRPDAGVDMTFDFPTLIAHAAKTRPLGAGVIVGSGTVSNRDADGGPGKPVAQGGVGYSCIAELRSVETILTGTPQTSFLKAGDRVRIEMNDAQGRSIFGAIEQEVVAYRPSSRVAVSDAGHREPAMATKLLIRPLGHLYDLFRPITELLIRLAAGGFLAVHGYQILFGNIEGAGRFFESVGFDNSLLWAWVVGILEFGCGILLALGLLTRLAAGPIIVFLGVAVATYHWPNGFNWEARGVEYPVFWAIVVFHFLINGGGRWSLDALIGWEV